MENLNRIKGALADAGKTGVWLAGQLGKDPVTVSKWCTNTTQPDLQTLAKISDLLKINIKDLLVPFQSGYYYNKAMGGSFSIKSVLPALFPDDPALNYHNLEQIHNGGEAMGIFPKIKDMTPEDAAKTRHNLLKYCELDTYAMVKVWEKLQEAIR